MHELNFLRDLGNELLLSLVELDLVVVDQVAAVAIDGNDQGTELLGLELPHCLRHAEVKPLYALYVLNALRSNYCASAGEDGVYSLGSLAALSCLGTHAALTDNDLNACLSEELLLGLLHSHGCCRTYSNALPLVFADLLHDRTCVEDSLALEVYGALSALNDYSVVNVVSSCCDVTCEIDYVADMDLLDILIRYRCSQMPNTHNVTPLLVTKSYVKSGLILMQPLL